MARRRSISQSSSNQKANAARRRSATGQSFPIAGIGASAGGLEAFTQLLGALLSHATPLPIHEARDGMQLEANHIYVIPPNTNLAVLHGRLSLMPRIEARGQHLPVDFFLRSLAADQKGRAIGVILSGTASDGTEGLRAIKAEGGLTFSQDEKSAKYNGMPHSAIAAGVVDFVLPPEGIARELARLGRHPYVALPAANRAYCDFFRTSAEETEKRFLYDLGKAQWNIPELRELLDKILPKNSHFENFEVEADFPGLGRRKILLNARRIADDGKKTQSILLAMEEAKG